MSYMGIDWRLENNNSVHACPYKKADCALNHEYLRRSTGHKHNIVQCAFRFSNNVYDYNRSYEKVWDEYRAIQEQKKKEFFSRLKWNPDATTHCACIKWDDVKQEWYARHDPWDCVHGCYEREICVLTGKRLDGKRGNVYYDVKITRVIHDGSFWDGQNTVNIIKGRRMLDNPKPMAICEAYAKLCKNWIDEREKSRFFRELFFNKDMMVEVVNIRAECRDTRDLLQDLRDAREGIKVFHASDLQKAAKQAKRERIQKRKEARQKRKEKRFIENLKRIVDTGSDIEGNPASEVTMRWAKKELEKRGAELDQVSIFEIELGG